MEKNIKSIWNIIKDFINSKPIGTVITRRELLDEIYKIYRSPYIYDPTDKRPGASQPTIDSYRNILTQRTEYLKQTDKSGVYIINKHIPLEMSGSDIRQLYDSLK